MLLADAPRTGFHTPTRDRVVAALAAAGVVALLGAMLLFGLTMDAIRRGVEPPLVLLNIKPPPPPPPPREEPRHRQAQLAKHAPSARNLRNKPTPVVAPPPPLIAPPPPILAAKAPGTGTAANAGASDRAGPGAGAGGFGNGTGGGGNGGDGDETPPRQTRGDLRYSDLQLLRKRGIDPARMDRLMAAAARAFLIVEVRYSVEPNGRMGACMTTRTSGYPELDALTCELMQQRFRFAPSRDGSGRPVRAVVDDSAGWKVDPEDEPAR